MTQPTDISAWKRLLAFALSAISCAALLLAQQLAAEGGRMMLQGMSMESAMAVMETSVIWLSVGMSAFALGVIIGMVIHWKQWRQALRFPTPLTILALVPGLYVLFVLLPYTIYLRINLGY